MPPRPTATVDLLEDESGDLVSESWDAYYVQDAKVGHRHTQVFHNQNATPETYRVVAVDQLELKRYGELHDQQLRSVMLYDANGVVRQLAYQLKAGDETHRVQGTVRNAMLELTQERGEYTQSRRLNWSQSNGGFFAVERSLSAKPMRAGERREVAAFLPLLDRAVTFRLKAYDVESTELPGGPQQLLKIEATQQLSEGWADLTTYWIDSAGTIMKSAESFLNRVTFRVSEKDATKPNDSLRIDLGLDVRVPLSDPIRDAESTQSAVYLVQTDRLNPLSVFANGPGQSVEPIDDHQARIRVHRVGPRDIAPSTTPPSAADSEPNRLVQSDDPRVVAMAAVGAGSGTDPWDVAVSLERYIHRTIREVDFSQVFGSAAQVAVDRKGDCSEHAVLLAATCRARGIPARVVLGLIYSSEHQGFLYHMWNEVWITDRWIPLDATVGHGGIAATHLKFRDSHLRGETAYSLIAPVTQIVGQLHIDLEDITYQDDAGD